MSPQVKIFERPRQTALSLLGLQFSAADNFAIPIFCEIESSATLTAIGSQQTLFFLLSSLMVNRDKSFPKYLLLFLFGGLHMRCNLVRTINQPCFHFPSQIQFQRVIQLHHKLRLKLQHYFPMMMFGILSICVLICPPDTYLQFDNC